MNRGVAVHRIYGSVCFQYNEKKNADYNFFPFILKIITIQLWDIGCNSYCNS